LESISSTYNLCLAFTSKKNSQAISLFALLGSAQVKAAHKHVDEIDPLGMKNCAGYAQWVKTNCFVYLF